MSRRWPFHIHIPLHAGETRSMSTIVPTAVETPAPSNLLSHRKALIDEAFAKAAEYEILIQDQAKTATTSDAVAIEELTWTNHVHRVYLQHANMLEGQEHLRNIADVSSVEYFELEGDIKDARFLRDHHFTEAEKIRPDRRIVVQE
ncbi:hypothetical protein FRB91_007619 [Serendipita sp. 411]|nr:hypothetical protein FRB91_007619 [Serendipita sp. 411]